MVMAHAGAGISSSPFLDVPPVGEITRKLTTGDQEAAR
jgi:hypothetical protein